MTSSSKRPHTSNSKQGESTSKSNPLNLTRLLANDDQRKVFEENFHGRAIFTPKYANDIYPELVRVFYCNMNFRKNLMTSHVKGKDVVLDMKTFSSICCDISMIGDITSAINLRERKVDVEVVYKMRFLIDHDTRRIYKHRTDHQPAPTDEREPTALNQLESHAPSSSSAAMPTNQMIMDELVSLRGYITTRMDAFNTQSQQIHYELHRLSSRLSNMNVDEDSSEPES
ncbi:hypothetical protein Lal_00021225 [Lupinus albus]|nr:hypothetical protein Lal_00021225 [Lupinus albus]